MKIVNFGSCNIDHVYSLDHIVRPGETQTSGKIEIFPGGKGLNQSIAAAKAGARVYHAGCIGVGGEMLADILSENNVDIGYLDKTDEKNGHAVIQVSSRGENAIFIYPGSNNMVTMAYIDRVLDKFEREDTVLLQNEISNAEYVAERAYVEGMTVIFNPSPYNEKINRVDFNKLDYIILNEVEIAEISGSDDTEIALKILREMYPKLKIVLTLGENGCVYADDKCKVYQPAFKVEAVDTTAAGDTFTGYFAAEISKGTDIRTVLRAASAASAITVSKPGAAPSIPCAAEVLAALDGLEEKQNGRREESIRRKTEEYINCNPAGANIAELAEILGYSAVYTGNLIKRITGKTFTEAVMEKRLRIAAGKLTDTDIPIDRIIGEAGYENKDFFRKKFREQYGVNPLQFRKGENGNDK